jgi:hypothetical protein
MNSKKTYKVLIVILPLVFQVFGQSVEPKLSEVKNIVETLLSKKKQEQYESLYYFDLYYQGNLASYEKSETLKLYTNRDSAYSKENSGIGNFTFLKNGTLGICYRQGSVGTTVAFTIYPRKNVFGKTTRFPRYKFFEYGTITCLEIETDRNRSIRYKIIELNKSQDDYTFVLKRLL